MQNKHLSDPFKPKVNNCSGKDPQLQDCHLREEAKATVN